MKVRQGTELSGGNFPGNCNVKYGVSYLVNFYANKTENVSRQS